VTRTASLVLPALLLSIAAALVLVRPLPDWLAGAVQAAPLVVFGGGALVGLFIGRGRLVLGLMVLALADLALVRFSGRAVFDAVALLLPLNLCAIAWLGEANLLTVRGGSQLGLPLLQAVAVVILQHPQFSALAALLKRPLVAANLGTWTALPQLALFAFAAALCLVLARFLVDGRAPAGGAAWALVASFLALDGAAAGGRASIHLVAAGLLLLVGAAREPVRPVYLDDVTGLPVSFALNKALRRLPRRYALARVDIDEFETFRAENGSDAARRTLRLVARALTKGGGRGSVFYCGEHVFAVIFRRTSAQAAARHLELVRRTVERADLDVRVAEPSRPGQPKRVGSIVRTVSVTLSVGVAEPEGRGADPHEVLSAADRALDRAKEAGENRVSM
jgi:diguanylate cyclase (GGDEF)-like protein